MNTLKTAFLLTALTLFLIFIGAYFGGRNGMILAFFVAAGMNFFSYFYSDKLALSMYRAQPVTREQLPRVYQIVERILPRMALPMPRIYVIPSDSPNAFATGRNPKHAAVAVTQGILNLLNDEELEGVLAHELGHVRNRDILTSSIAATLAGAITLLAHIARWAGFFGGAAGDRWPPRHGRRRSLHAHSRSHCGDPYPAGRFPVEGVRGRRHRGARHRKSLCPGQRIAKARRLFQATAHAGFAIDCASVYRCAPSLSGASFANLFSTHPPMASRIERLTGRAPLCSSKQYAHTLPFAGLPRAWRLAGRAGLLWRRSCSHRV